MITTELQSRYMSDALIEILVDRSTTKVYGPGTRLQRDAVAAGGEGGGGGGEGHPAGLAGASQQFEGLQDDEAGDEGVGGGHRVHDVARHALGGEYGLGRDAVAGPPQVCSRRHKVHCQVVLLAVAEDRLWTAPSMAALRE